MGCTASSRSAIKLKTIEQRLSHQPPSQAPSNNLHRAEANVLAAASDVKDKTFGNPDDSLSSELPETMIILEQHSPETKVETKVVLEKRHKLLLSKIVGTGSVIVANIKLPCAMSQFSRVFWTSGSFYADFLGSSLGDEDVVVSPWIPRTEEVD